MTGWERVRLKHIAAGKITTGVGLPAEHQEPSWPRYIRTTDIAGPRRLRDDVVYTQPPSLLREAEVRRGDVLVSTAGSVGVSYLHTSDEPAVYAGYLARVRPSSAVEPRFLSYWTQSRDFWDQVNAGSVRSTISNFSAGRIQNMGMWLPERREQSRISDMLDRETSRLEVMNEHRHGLEQLLIERDASLSTHAFDKLITEYGTAKLKYLTPGITVGIVVTPAQLYTAQTSGAVPCLRGMNLSPGRVDPTSLVHIPPETNARHRKSQLRAGDVVAVRTGEAGVAAVVPDWADGANCVDLLIIRRSPQLDGTFLQWFLNSEAAVRQFREGEVGAIQAHFNVSALRELRVPNAPVHVQRETAARLEAEVATTQSLQDRLVQQNKLSRERQEALISYAIGGHLDVEEMAA